MFLARKIFFFLVAGCVFLFAGCRDSEPENTQSGDEKNLDAVEKPAQTNYANDIERRFADPVYVAALKESANRQMQASTRIAEQHEAVDARIAALRQSLPEGAAIDETDEELVALKQKAEALEKEFEKERTRISGVISAKIQEGYVEWRQQRREEDRRITEDFNRKRAEVEAKFEAARKSGSAEEMKEAHRFSDEVFGRNTAAAPQPDVKK